MLSLHPDARRFAFGGTSAIVTGMGLIIGLDAAAASRMALVGSLLIIGLADNLTDSLSVHMYQEAEHLDGRQALRTTVTNFLARFAITLSFVGFLITLPFSTAIIVSLIWGFVLLALMSLMLARLRRASALAEIWKHTAVAVTVIIASKIIGTAIPALIASI